MQNRMDEARQKEWEKYKTFNAVVVVHGEEKRKLLDEGHEVVPSKWAETIKNIHEQDQPGYVPVHKARLVSCGNLERVEKGELRCDSPTSDPECHLLLASFAATMKWNLCTADITNAYFQSAPMTRLLLMNPPRGGLSKYDPEVPAVQVAFCCVVYLSMGHVMQDVDFTSEWTVRLSRLDLWQATLPLQHTTCEVRKEPWMP